MVGARHVLNLLYKLPCLAELAGLHPYMEVGRMIMPHTKKAKTLLSLFLFICSICGICYYGSIFHWLLLLSSIGLFASLIANKIIWFYSFFVVEIMLGFSLHTEHDSVGDIIWYYFICLFIIQVTIKAYLQENTTESS